MVKSGVPAIAVHFIYISNFISYAIFFMRKITKINITDSIKRGWLVYQGEVSDKFDKILVYCISLFMLIGLTIGVWHIDPSKKDDIFVSLLFLPFAFALFIYMIYRNATEKKLISVVTPYNHEINKQMLLDFASKAELEIYKDSKDLLIFNENISDVGSFYKKSMIFIVEDNLVLFTILQDNFRLNRPVLTSHLFLKHDLKKLFSKSD